MVQKSLLLSLLSLFVLFPQAVMAQSSGSRVLLSQGSYGGHPGYFAMTNSGAMYFFSYGVPSGWQHISDAPEGGISIFIQGGDRDGHLGVFAVTEGGTLYFWSEGNGRWDLHSMIGQAPSSSVTSITSGSDGAGHPGMFAATTTGDIYFYSNGTGSWTLQSNIYGPTPNGSTTWGSIKVHNR